MTFAEFLNTYHGGAKPEEFRPAETPGYWERKVPCDPTSCREPIHGCIGNEGGIKHTVFYENQRRVHGRFASREIRFRTWLAAREFDKS